MVRGLCASLTRRLGSRDFALPLHADYLDRRAKGGRADPGCIADPADTYVRVAVAVDLSHGVTSVNDSCWPAAVDGFAPMKGRSTSHCRLPGSRSKAGSTDHRPRRVGTPDSMSCSVPSHSATATDNVHISELRTAGNPRRHSWLVATSQLPWIRSRAAPAAKRPLGLAPESVRAAAALGTRTSSLPETTRMPARVA